MELRCRPIACVVFFVLLLVCSRGIKGSDLSPSSQVTAASPSMGMQASCPVSHENLPRTSTPSSAPTSNEGDLPPKVLPPKPLSMGPTIQNISPSVLPSYPPGQLPSDQGYRASSPSVESHWPIAPAVAGDVSPSRSISSPPPPPPPLQTTKGDTNGTSPSVSSSPLEIPPKPPLANRSIIAPPPSSIGASHVKDFPTPALPPVFSVSPVNHGERNHVPAAAPPTGTSSDISPVHYSPLGGFVPVSSPKSQESLISPGVAPAPIISHSPPNDQPPASVPTHSNNQGSSSGNSSSSPSSDQAPVISPLPSLPPKAVPRNHSSDHVPPPIAHGPYSMQSPVPSVTAKTAPVPLPPHVTPSSQRHGLIVSPLPSVGIPFQEGTPVPSPFGSLPVASSRQNHGAFHSPVVSPSGSLVLGSGNPLPPPAQVLPPPAQVLPPSPMSVPQPKRALPPLPAPVAQPKRAPVVSPSGSLAMGSGNPSQPPAQVLPPSPMSVPRPKRALPPSPAPVTQPKRAPVVSPSGSLAMGSGNPSQPPAQVLPPSPMSVPRPKRALPPSPAPVTQPKRAPPPPPANLDCTTLSCTDPFTNSPPGPVCACVRPMKVELRLGVALYTFFPLVSELAQQIASGTSMKQSQVRIMGANAATEQPEKTLVLVDLVPLGKFFDRTTALLTAEKFWHKQVGIKVSDFGDYDVLYVTYPGLPPSPPMPAGNNVNGGAFGNENNSRRIHPLGVDVRKRREKLGGSLIAIIALSSVIALVLLVGAAWFLFLKPSNGASLSRQVPQNSLPLISKALGTRPMVLGSRPSSASGSFTSSIATYTGSAKTFTVAEIEKATNKFEDSNVIGEGGFGRVYQGILEDGTKVAVKVLKRDDQQGSREFLAEVEMLGRLHHRNLVKLIGICTEEHLRSLIYELIPNGSVDSHLHGSDKEIAPLDWGARVKIALGSARGLAYLHEDSSPRVIHRDFKSSNILLECDFTPKVSDFGLARTALDEGNGHISTRVMGTFGYVAPEYAMTGHLLVKSDVYSYGVVLLELLTGRKPVDMLRPPGQENLVTWARPLLTSKEGLETITDPALGSNVSFDSVAKVAAIASMCVQPEVSHRPFMGEVVQALKLVCNESDEHRVSRGCSQGDPTDQDPELRICTSLVPGADRVLSASEIFSTSATLTRDASSSFWRQSSSGPLRTNRTGQFWKKLMGLSKGSMSEHAFALGSRTSGERWPGRAYTMSPSIHVKQDVKTVV